MSLVSIRLPDAGEARLTREAEQSQRPKSEIARDAIVDYLRRLDRDRFLGEIARAARARGEAEAVASAEEALPLDNESLAIAEGAGVGESRASYGARSKRGKPKKKKR
jgi:predicted transcriptional regulator